MTARALTVADHLLVGVPYTRSPSQGPLRDAPRAIVMHYTAGRSLEGAVRTLTSPSRKASAHLVVGRDGALHQLVRFDRAAWHAGKSEWRGRPRCNDWTLGIELVNLGWMATATDDAELWRDADGRAWQAYPHAQLDQLIEVVRALLAAYPTITELIGHEDIAPGRKVDPGPAFPWARFRALLPG